MQESPPAQCPAVPACPQLFLVPLPRPWVSVQQPKPLQTGEVRLGLGKGPSITSLALPCGDVQIVPEKEKFGQENARDVLKGLCLLAPGSPAARMLGRAHGCSEPSWHRVVWDGGSSCRGFQLAKGVQLHREWGEPCACTWGWWHQKRYRVALQGFPLQIDRARLAK